MAGSLKSRVSSRRAGSAKTVGELTSKGLFFKRAGGYLGQRAWALPSASAPPAGALACLPASWGTLVHRLSMSTATIAATVTTAAAGRFRRLRRATIAAAISASTATIAATVASAAASQKSFFVFLRWGRAGLTSRWGCRSNTTGNSCVPHQVFPVWGLGHFLVTVTGATIRHDGLCEKMSETPNRKNLMARFSIPIYIYIYILAPGGCRGQSVGLSIRRSVGLSVCRSVG